MRTRYYNFLYDEIEYVLEVLWSSDDFADATTTVSILLPFYYCAARLQKVRYINHCIHIPCREPHNAHYIINAVFCHNLVYNDIIINYFIAF